MLQGLGLSVLGFRATPGLRVDRGILVCRSKGLMDYKDFDQTWALMSWVLDPPGSSLICLNES